METYWPAVKENGEAVHSFIRSREKERERDQETPGKREKKAQSKS